MPTNDELKIFQNLPLDFKIFKTQLRIKEWVDYYGTDGVYVSFSGGKDSTVLLDIVRKMYPSIEAVFINTGLEHIEIQQHVKSYDNVTTIYPKMRFDEVVAKYGYPVISKALADCLSGTKESLLIGKDTFRTKRMLGQLTDGRGRKSIYNLDKWQPLLNVDFKISAQCCRVLKKAPAKKFEKSANKVPMTAQMAAESQLRKQQWLLNGCNAFEKKRPISNPMGFWREQDVLTYIKENNLKIASVYGDIVSVGKKLKCTGCARTGCIFCGFGLHLGKGTSRFETLKQDHPRQYEYCIEGGGYDETDGLWKPTAQGLGLRHVFNEINKVYGEKFIRF